MSLIIVEDGTIVDNANAYIDVDYADNYLSITNKSGWNDYSILQKEKSIIEATQTIDLSYTFSGEVTDVDQALEFPRINCYDKQRNIFLSSSIIPVALKNAVCELAYTRLSSGENLLEATGSEVLKKEKIGSIEIERFNQARLPDVQKFKKVTTMLERYSKKLNKSFLTVRG